MIAIPDFVSGAMEHWGLITFREVNLLYDTKNSSPRNKQRVAAVIAHELAHMVFDSLPYLNENVTFCESYRLKYCFQVRLQGSGICNSSRYVPVSHSGSETS